MDEASLAALARFAVHLTARIEALEALLIQKGAATKEEIQRAILQAEGDLAAFQRGVAHPGDKEFDRALAELLKRLKSRHIERLR